MTFEKPPIRWKVLWEAIFPPEQRAATLWDPIIAGSICAAVIVLVLLVREIAIELLALLQ